MAIAESLRMTILKRVTFAEVRAVFRAENQKAHDPYPEDCLTRAERQFSGEWYEGTLSPSDMLEIKLPWNIEFNIPEAGLTVADALKLPKVLSWQAPPYSESHVLLSTLPVIGIAEYEKMRVFEGRLIHLDGLHRLWPGRKSERPKSRCSWRVTASVVLTQDKREPASRKAFFMAGESKA